MSHPPLPFASLPLVSSNWYNKRTCKYSIFQLVCEVFLQLRNLRVVWGNAWGCGGISSGGGIGAPHHTDNNGHNFKIVLKTYKLKNTTVGLQNITDKEKSWKKRDSERISCKGKKDKPAEKSWTQLQGQRDILIRARCWAAERCLWEALRKTMEISMCLQPREEMHAACLKNRGDKTDERQLKVPIRLNS